MIQSKTLWDPSGSNYSDWVIYFISGCYLRYLFLSNGNIYVWFWGSSLARYLSSRVSRESAVKWYADVNFMNEGHRIFSQLLRRAKTRHIQINPTLLTNLQYEIKIPTNQLLAFAILRLHTPNPECVLQVDAGMWCDWRQHMTTTSKNGALIFGSATDIPCPFEDTHKCNECNYACSQADTLTIHMTTVSNL